VAPQQLLQASGAQGVDPFTAVMQTLAKALGGGVVPQMHGMDDAMQPLAGVTSAPAPAPRVIPGVDQTTGVRPQGGGPVTPPPTTGRVYLNADPNNPTGPLRPNGGGSGFSMRDKTFPTMSPVIL
jgi:hypothetical protein